MEMHCFHRGTSQMLRQRITMEITGTTPGKFSPETPRALGGGRLD